MSSTVNKALSLLGFFTEAAPELGLSEVSRLAEIDKATAYRLLKSLAAHGLLEQHRLTRLYRLGAGVLHLARIREAAFPVLTAVQPLLELLSATTGETAHASLYSNGRLTTIGTVESKKGSRVSLRAAETLPMHATASGIAFLSYARDETVAGSLAGKLKAYTRHTCTNRDDLHRLIETARKAGFAIADQTYEDDVYGIAAPLFGSGGEAAGAVAVATPCHRLTRELRSLATRSAMEAAVELSRKLGNEPPVSYLRLCQRRAA